MNPARANQAMFKATPNAANSSVLLHRRRACGRSTVLSRQCENCRKNKFSQTINPQIQSTIKIGLANDKYEHEADSMADYVMQTDIDNQLKQNNNRQLDQHTPRNGVTRNGVRSLSYE